MHDAGIDARVKFLDTSARLLQSKVPETSAHLMQQRNEVVEEFSRSLNKAQLKDICKACGTILVPGSNFKVSVAVKSEKRRKIARGPEAPEAQSQIECLSCHRVTVAQMPQPQENRRVLAKPVPLAKPSSLALPETISSDGCREETKKPASANAGSKKRAKARKQGGLQALLEKSKGRDSMSGSPGLDLMDFMKKT
ncbi:MAG: hypothetical protein Q9216_001314 [Gyalolechia sp. 2 TL-2023]